MSTVFLDLMDHPVQATRIFCWTIYPDILYIKHSCSTVRQFMWFMAEPIQFSVGQTAQSLTCSIMEKPHTGLDDCLRMLLTCLRKRMSVPKNDSAHLIGDQDGWDLPAVGERALLVDVYLPLASRRVRVRVPRVKHDERPHRALEVGTRHRREPLLPPTTRVR